MWQLVSLFRCPLRTYILDFYFSMFFFSLLNFWYRYLFSIFSFIYLVISGPVLFSLYYIFISFLGVYNLISGIWTDSLVLMTSLALFFLIAFAGSSLIYWPGINRNSHQTSSSTLSSVPSQATAMFSVK